jgi:hypothetical protein
VGLPIVALLQEQNPARCGQYSKSHFPHHCRIYSRSKKKMSIYNAGNKYMYGTCLVMYYTHGRNHLEFEELGRKVG